MQGAEGIGLHKLLWGFFRKGSCEGSIWEFPKIGDPNIVPEIVGNPKIRYPYFGNSHMGARRILYGFYLCGCFGVLGLRVWGFGFGPLEGLRGFWLGFHAQLQISLTP